MAQEKLSEKFLEKCFHSLRTSMIREMKKFASGNEFIYVYLFIHLFIYVYLFMFADLIIYLFVFIIFIYDYLSFSLFI